MMMAMKIVMGQNKMELDVLKNFIKKDVEVLVGGIWIEGHMTPIAKGLIVLLPIGLAKDHYGPTACKAEVIQAVREVRRPASINVAVVPSDPAAPPAVQSSLGTTSKNHPGNKYVHK
jgi:hypothetical protein